MKKISLSATYHSDELGFTFVELILVLLIVGILSVFATSHLNTDVYSVRSTVDQAQSMLRYAQKIAIAQNRNVYVVFDASGGSLCFTANCSSRVMTPANAVATIGLPSGVSGNISPLIAGFYFNGLGRPFNLSDNGVNSTFSKMTIAVQGSGATWQIVVEPETGYVHQ